MLLQAPHALLLSQTELLLFRSRFHEAYRVCEPDLGPQRPHLYQAAHRLYISNLLVKLHGADFLHVLRWDKITILLHDAALDCILLGIRGLLHVHSG